MGLFDAFFNKTFDRECEFCPRCEANLTLQKGYSNVALSGSAEAVVRC